MTDKPKPKPSDRPPKWKHGESINRFLKRQQVWREKQLKEPRR